MLQKSRYIQYILASAHSNLNMKKQCSCSVILYCYKNNPEKQKYHIFYKTIQSDWRLNTLHLKYIKSETVNSSVIWVYKHSKRECTIKYLI